MTDDIRPEVLSFAKLMSAKLDRHNEDRGCYGWRVANLPQLMQWLDHYMTDLRAEQLSKGSYLIDKAVNVANLAMMIADVAAARGLRPEFWQLCQHDVLKRNCTECMANK